MSAKTPAAHRPLSGTALQVLILSTTGVIALCYAGCLLALLLIGVVLVVEVILLIALARFGLGGYMVEPIRGELRLASLVLRSLNLQRGADYFMALPRQDASRLYDKVRSVAERVEAPLPDQMVLEMSANAWVHLRGYRRGRGHSTLGLGYDLLAVMTEAELEAVVAHELAHAKLIQRGYTGWLRNGIARMGQLAAALYWVSASAREEGKRFWTAALLARGADLLARLGSRLVAAYSRQDEFAADRIAAQICGADVCRRMLIKTHIAGQKAADLSWRDRLLQWGREASVSDWLRARLVPPEEERLELEQQALQESRRGEFDTHPVLADRLAALPAGAPADAPSPPALGLLDDPDSVAVRLLEELERIANEEERKDSEQLRRWLRREARAQKHTPLQWVGIVVAVLGLMICLMTLGFLQGSGVSAGAALAQLVVGGLVMAAGFFIHRKGAFRERLLLPVPAWSRWHEALGSETRSRPPGDWWEPLAAELRPRLPAALKGRRARARFWGEQCYQALEQCDFQRALVAARFSQEARPHSLEGALGSGVAAAYFGDGAAVEQMLGWALAAFGLGPSVSWAVGWAFSMLGNWPGAEPYLLDIASRRPSEPTIRALLGTCQWQQGRLREAAESLRQAVALEPREPGLRLLLARVLLAAGRAKQALGELEQVEGDAAAGFTCMLGWVSAQLLLGRTEEAARRAALLQETHPGPLALLRLGQVYADANRSKAARGYLEAAAGQAFYPKACLGLARIAYDANEREKARAHLLAALDLARDIGPEGDGPLALLEPIMQGLTAINEPAEGCQAWWATLDLSRSPAPAQALSLLVVAPSRGEAEAQVRRIYHAMHPDQDPATAIITWEPVEPAQQPVGPAAPGVYGHRFQ